MLSKYCMKKKDGQHTLIPNTRKDKRPQTVEGFRCRWCNQVTGNRKQ